MSNELSDVRCPLCLGRGMLPGLAGPSTGVGCQWCQGTGKVAGGEADEAVQRALGQRAVICNASDTVCTLCEAEAGHGQQVRHRPGCLLAGGSKDRARHRWELLAGLVLRLFALIEHANRGAWGSGVCSASEQDEGEARAREEIAEIGRALRTECDLFDRFYIVSRKHGYVGNDMLFWQQGGGYTCDVSRAQLFTAAEAAKIHSEVEGNIMVPAEWVCRHATLVWDMQNAPAAELRAVSEAALAAAKVR